MPAAIEIPRRQDFRYEARLCVDGVCDVALLDSHWTRERDWVQWLSPQSRIPMGGTIQIFPGGDDFRLVLSDETHRYTWEGNCEFGELAR